MLKWNRVICVLSRNLRHLEKCFWFPWFCSWPFLDFLFSLVSKTWRNKFPVIGDFLVLWKPDLRLWSIFKPLSTLFFFFSFEIKKDSLTKFLTGRVSKNWISVMTCFQMGKSTKCCRHQEGQVGQSSQTPAIPCWHYWDQGIWH